MIFNLSKSLFTKSILLLLFIITIQTAFSQKMDSLQSKKKFSGAVSVTNNGISLIPSFNLGKPAAIFDLSLGGKRLSFEPQFRFSLEGKPWTFLFWWRYKLINQNKFKIGIGAHPGFAFKDKIALVDGKEQSIVTSQRYLAGEVAPTYHISEKTTLGLYYLYSHGFDPFATRNTHFLAARVFFNKINLSKKLYMNFMPQFYYLNINNAGGIYVNHSLVVGLKKTPLSVSTMMSKKIHSAIAAKDFIWNVSLHYGFGGDYRKSK